MQSNDCLLNIKYEKKTIIYIISISKSSHITIPLNRKHSKYKIHTFPQHKDEPQHNFLI